MVAGEEMNLYTHVGYFGQFAQESGVSFGHHILVFVPEIKHVAQQIDSISLVLDAVQKSHQASFLRSFMLESQRAPMRIR